MSCAGNYFRYLPTPNSIQSLDKKMYWNFAMRWLNLRIDSAYYYMSVHVASSCTQGNRSAALVLPFLMTTFSCLEDTTSPWQEPCPWSVPIRESCSTGKEKFLFVLVNSQGGCPISRDPGVRSDAYTAILSSLAPRRIFKAGGEISVPHTTSILSTFLNWFITNGRRRSLCTLEMSRSL